MEYQCLLANENFHASFSSFDTGNTLTVKKFKTDILIIGLVRNVYFSCYHSSLFLLITTLNAEVRKMIT